MIGELFFYFLLGYLFGIVFSFFTEMAPKVMIGVWIGATTLLLLSYLVTPPSAEDFIWHWHHLTQFIGMILGCFNGKFIYEKYFGA